MITASEKRISAIGTRLIHAANSKLKGNNNGNMMNINGIMNNKEEGYHGHGHGNYHNNYHHQVGN